MSMMLEALGVDPLFPGRGTIYKSRNGYHFNEINGGEERMTWLRENFIARPDDVYVISYPKTGTTWAQEIVYVLMADLNFEKANSIPIAQRVPFLENKFCQPFIPSLSSPRCLKSHLPYSLLPETIVSSKAKIVCTLRNPKDTLISYYFFSMNNKKIGYEGDLETLFNLFLEGKVEYGPFWKHVKEYWEKRDQDNIFIMHYEDMIKDLHQEVGRLASFLGKTLTTTQTQMVVDHCSFKNMKRNPMANYEYQLQNFMRKGKVGDWKSYFTDQMNEKMDAYIETHFGTSGLGFQYE